MANGTVEINYDATTTMSHEFPRIRKTGVIGPHGESTPFVFNGELYRLELVDSSRGTDMTVAVHSVIRHRESGRVLSRVAEGCYYQSFYLENGVAYVIGVRTNFVHGRSGDTFLIYESRDLIHWTERTLLSRPGWHYFNSSLTKGPDGYVLCMEAGRPAEAVGTPFTMFFATSPDMVHWTFLDDDLGFSKERYMGGPWFRYSEGWYYLIAVTELPCQHYTNYIYRTKDFVTWYVGLYNPILMPSNEDRLISPYANDMTPQLIEWIRTGCIINNSDIDMCDWNGKTLLVYIAGNQLGLYYCCEAEYDGTVAELLASYFE